MSYRSINPFTEQLVAEHPEHTDAEVEAILAAADDAYRTGWRARSYGDRGKVLDRAADLLSERREELARLATTEMGKRYVELLYEVDFCVDILRYYASNAERILATQDLDFPDGRARMEAHPLGVILGIEPWNFPFYQVLRVAAPVLMAGNTVVMKHAPNVPGVALAIEKLFTDAGAPAGAYSNVFLTNEQAANVIADGRVRGVALTGSERAGAEVGAVAGRALKKISLELGGSDPFVVLDDADLDLAVTLGAAGRLMNTGQACAASKRFIVHASLYEQFVQRLCAQFASLTPGDPMDEATGLGPLAGQAALERALEQIQLAQTHGATVAVGGHRIARQGFFLEPTVLTGVSADNPVFAQEIFAQVAMVFSVQDEQEAIELANATGFGLGVTVISGDIERAENVAAQIESGMVFLNRPGAFAPNLPWGGVKNSGYGRGLADFGITEFVNWKLVVRPA